MSSYISVIILRLNQKEVGSEILIAAELEKTAFESFTETETEVSALHKKGTMGREHIENIRIL
jgi:hypothetical protein